MTTHVDRRAALAGTAALVLGAAERRPTPGAADAVAGVPGLVAFWDFQGPPGRRAGRGPGGRTLREVNGPVERIEPPEGAPFGRYAADLRYRQRFEVARADMGPLDIRGKDARVSVVAWIRRRKATDFGKPSLANEAVAGVWREHDHKRQYALFLGIATNARMMPKTLPQRVSGHVSDTGGRSPGQPWCYEVALGSRPVPWDAWVCVGFTYDGRLIRSYDDGEFVPVEGFNPYEQPNGIFDAGPGGADFVIGHSDVRQPRANNQLVAVLGGVAVFDRALGGDEMRRLAEPVAPLRRAVTARRATP